jgi:hypothetical protein
MSVGADETSMLTQRIRSRPADDETASEPPSRPGKARVPAGAGPARVHARVSLFAAAATVVAALAGGTAWAAGGVDGPGWLDHGDEAPRPPVATPVAGGDHAPARPGVHASTAADPLTDRRAPSRDVPALMQALADARAAAMGSADPSALALLDAPQSEAMARDSAALRAMAERGERYDGVRLQLRSARLVSVTPTKATVDAAVDTAAYRVVAVGGTREVAATRGQVLRFGLVWVGGRWLVESVHEQGTPE